MRHKRTTTHTSDAMTATPATGKRRRSIRRRLIGWMLALLALLLAIVVLEEWNQRIHLDRMITLRDESLQRVQLIKSVSDAYGLDAVDTTFRVRNQLISWDSGVEVIDAAMAKIDRDWARLEGLPSTLSQRQVLSAIRDKKAVADDSVRALRGILKKRDIVALGKFADTRLYPSIDPITTRLQSLAALEQLDVDRVIAAETKRMRNISVIRIVLAVLFLFAFTLSARRLVRGITHGVEGLTKLSERIGQRDFAYEPVRRPSGELGQVMDTLLKMRDEIARSQQDLADQLVRNERVRANLQRSESQQRSLIESAQVAVISIDAEGIAQEFNPFAEKLTGYSAKEILGKPLPTLLHDSEEMRAATAELSRLLARDVGAGTHYFLAAADTGQPPHEWRFRRKDGSVVPVLLATSKLKGLQGETASYMGVATDLTEIKQLEERMRVSEAQAREASRAKSSFLATMSHEIRTPMIGVNGMIEVLSFTRLDDEQKKILKVVRSSADALLQIIGDILDFSKIEARQLSLAPSVADLAGLVQSTVANYDGAASGKGLVLTCTIGKGVAPVYVFDALRIRQILSNFLSNAIKFTERGFIEVELSLQERQFDRDRLQLRVTDTGIGVPAEKQAKLFAPFTQADDTTTRRYGGTGLGLSICRHLADLMQARIEMRSEVGLGTTLMLSIELAQGDPQQLPAQDTDPADAAFERRVTPSIEQAQHEGRLILVADDHPTNRHVVVRQLHLAGFAAVAVDGGISALEHWRSGRFALLLTDVHMPDMDGYALTGEIRAEEARRGLARLPIVALTAAALKVDAEKCLQVGMDAYLSKPVSMQRLQACLDQWLPVVPHRLAPLIAASVTPPISTSAAMPQHAETDRDSPREDVVLDPSVIVALTGDARPSEIRALVEEFIEACEQDLSALSSAFAQRNAEEIGHQAHRIKGAARLIGAVALSERAAALEAAARRATVRLQPHDPERHDPEGHDPEGHDPEGHDPEGHDPEGHDLEGNDLEAIQRELERLRQYARTIGSEGAGAG
jgi:two-component system, NarL family, sensor histidine kinase EvgS